MKEIATISPERLNNGAHYQFMTSVLNYAVADEIIAEETHLKPLVQNLTTALGKNKMNGYRHLSYIASIKH